MRETNLCKLLHTGDITTMYISIKKTTSTLLPTHDTSKPNDMRVWFFITAILFIFNYPISAQQPVTKADTPENRHKQTFCPIQPDEPIKSGLWVKHQGKKVYFCCMTCRRRFQKDPNKWIKYLPQFSGHNTIKYNQATDTSAEATAANSDTDMQSLTTHDSSLITKQRQDPLLSFIGSFHPMLVHFPIALIISAWLAEMYGRTMKLTYCVNAARFCTILAAVTAPITLILGLLAEGANNTLPDMAETLTSHKYFSIAVCVAIILTCYISESARSKQNHQMMKIYRIGLFVSVILVTIAGHKGATLVFG